jgi:hypothetical protein
MNLLPMLRDGAMLAAQLAALTLSLPAAAADGPAVDNDVHARPPAAGLAAPDLPQTPHSLHLMASAFEFRLLGTLADVRVAQTFRNAGATAVDLAARLPVAAAPIERLAVVRPEGSFELIDGLAGGCGDEAAESADDEPLAGHADVTLDERAADALRLAPGDWARVEIAAVAAVDAGAALQRIELPPSLQPIEPHAQWIDSALGPRLLVVPPLMDAGLVTLTLRPADRPAIQQVLGNADGSPAAYLLAPMAIDAASLAGGAIEVEIATSTGTVWASLLTPSPAAATALRVAHAD